MGKYSRSDIKPGTEKELKNGAIGGFVKVRSKKNPKDMIYVWRIVQGVKDDEYMDKIRKAPRKVITPRSAKIAFNKYYNNPDNFVSQRARKSARTYDNNHTSMIRRTSAYKRNPRRFDYPDLDDGDTIRQPNAANIQRLALWHEAVRIARADHPKMVLKTGNTLHKAALKEYKVLARLAPSDEIGASEMSFAPIPLTPQEVKEQKKLVSEMEKNTPPPCHELRKNKSACVARKECKVRKTGFCVAR